MSSLKSVTIGNDRFVRVGDNGIIQWSDDATNWFLEVSGTTEHLHSVSYGNDVFIAVGENGTVLVSPSVGVWVPSVSGTSEHVYGIAYTEIFMAVGGNGLMMSSVDGDSWEILPAQTAENLRAVAMGAGLFLAVGDNDASVEGQFLSTFLQVEFDNDYLLGDETLNEGSFNIVANDGLGLIDDVARDAFVPPVYEFIDDRLTASHVGSTEKWVAELSISETHIFLEYLFDAGVTVAEKISLITSPLFGLAIDPVVETIALTEAPTWDAIFGTVVDEILELTHESLDSMIMLSVVEEDLNQLDELKAPTAVFSAILEDSFTFTGLLILDGEQFIAWVINTKNEAVSQYLNYNFNSFCCFDNHYYGANDNGIFELTGTDDAGVKIPAAVQTGLMNFGTNFQTRIPRAHIGMQNDGSVILKTVTNEGIERWYQARETASGMSRSRVPLTKGVRSNYWQFELVSNDFIRVDTLDLMPVVLSRRPHSRRG